MYLPVKEDQTLKQITGYVLEKGIELRLLHVDNGGVIVLQRL